MCGRYAFFRWPQALAQLPGFPADQAAGWNIAPGSQVLMIRAEAGQRQAARARWGLTPSWLTDLSRAPAQARAETLAEQPMFRDALRQRRCLLPANGFYEWRGSVRKRPYWLLADSSPLYFAGIWESYPVAELNWLSVAVVTQAAGGQRRPLILDESEQAVWLDPSSTPAQLTELLAGAQKPLRERPLATLVNDPALNGPECLTPA